MKNILLLLFIITCLSVFSQEDDLKFESHKSKIFADDTKFAFKISPLFPFIGAEAKLNEKFSLAFGSKLGVNFAVTGSQTNPQIHFYPQPVLNIEPKWNYNIVKRRETGKNTSKFSSNFLSLYTDINFKVSPQTFTYLTIGPTWGIQRNFSNYGYFKLNTGLGYRHIFSNLRFNYLPVAVIVNFELGFIF